MRVFGISEQFEVIWGLILLISSLGKSSLGSNDEITMFAIGNSVALYLDSQTTETLPVC